MLDDLRIRNFRMFDDFVVPRLGRINLIVGRNCSGKSTVLDALRILASQGNPRVLRSLLDQHDETSVGEAEATSVSDAIIANALRHLFPGRHFPLSDNLPIIIGCHNDDLLRIEHVLYRNEVDQSKADDGLVSKPSVRRVIVSKGDPTAFGADLKQDILVWSSSNRSHPKSFFLGLDGQMGLRRHPAWDPSHIVETPCSYVPTDFVSQDELSDLWDQVALTPFQDKVIEALRVIDSRLQGLTFIKAADTNGYPRRRDSVLRIPVVKLEGTDDRVPLGSMGDGMLRILQLALAVFPAKGGYLLIDEFENGLHFSVQDAVWKIIFTLASQLDIQVFATTHSTDCLRSFSRVARIHPGSGVLFKVSRSRAKSDSGKVIATVYGEDDLEAALASDMEVR